MQVAPGRFKLFQIRAGDIVYWHRIRKDHSQIDGPYRVGEIDDSNPSYRKASLYNVEHGHALVVESIGVCWLLPAQMVDTVDFKPTKYLPAKLPKRARHD